MRLNTCPSLRACWAGSVCLDSSTTLLEQRLQSFTKSHSGQSISAGIWAIKQDFYLSWCMRTALVLSLTFNWILPFLSLVESTCIIHSSECAAVYALKHSHRWRWACTTLNLAAQRSQVNEDTWDGVAWKVCVSTDPVGLVRPEASLTTSSGLHLKLRSFLYISSLNISKSPFWQKCALSHFICPHCCRADHQTCAISQTEAIRVCC